MIDKKAMYEDLLDAFIKYQYRLDNPFPDGMDTEIERGQAFRNDPIFNKKVKDLASGVMNIVFRHIEE